MFRRYVIALFVFVLPSLSWAQAPERLLPANSQVYLRWEGFATHRKAFEQTAVGKMMQGDTGKFLSALVTYLGNQIETLVGQAEPDLAKAVQEFPKILQTIGQHGFVLGIELGNILPPEVQGTLVFPKAGKDLIPAITRLTELGKAETKEIKIDGQTIRHAGLDPVHLAWWSEGDDAVFLIGTDNVERAVQRARGKGTNLTSNPLYKQVKSFKEFPTWGVGYVDLAGLLKKVKGLDVPGVPQLIDDLGLDGLKNITFHSGFEGPAERSVIEINLEGKRKGLLALCNQKKFSLADLPPMPDDITSFSATNLDVSKIYDIAIAAIESAVRIFAPNEAANVKDAIKNFEGFIGIKVGEDVLAHLGDMYVQYSSPGDGPLGLGSVSLIKVKNAKKLEAGLETLFKALGNIPGVNIGVQKKEYHGVTIHQLEVPGQGTFNLPAFAVHKGWLAICNYPQPIKGFILRTGGDLPAWKADGELGKRLSKLPKEYVGIAISDPRPTLKFVISVLPIGVSLLNTVGQFVPGFNLAPFDVNLIPNAHEAVRHLFPNITITTDDGKKIRSDTRASLALPF